MVDCRRAAALGMADQSVPRALLEDTAINPTTEPLKLTQDWGTRCLGVTESSECQDPGERSSDPTRD